MLLLGSEELFSLDYFFQSLALHWESWDANFVYEHDVLIGHCMKAVLFNLGFKIILQNCTLY